MLRTKNDILAVDDINLLNIDADNVDEVLEYETNI